MRITIDTVFKAIIVPDSYYMQADKLNEGMEMHHTCKNSGRSGVYALGYCKSCYEGFNDWMKR